MSRSPGELRTPRPPASNAPYHMKLKEAEEKGDTELAAYFTERQEESMAARARTLARLEHKKMPIGPRPPRVLPEAQM